MVDTNSITVKLKNPNDHPNFENVANNLGFTIKRENKLGYIDIHIPSQLNLFELYQTLSNTGLFESIEINSFGILLYLAPPSQTPNDIYYGLQHYLNHSTYPDINAPEGWGLCTNFGQGVLVAILDNGFDYEHPDLNNNIWPNVGWDFTVEPPTSILVTQRKRWHATMVAGVVSASTNNNLGIAGISGGWFGSNTGAQLMSIAVVQIWGVNTEYADDAIIYAAENGAKIINMSWKTEPLNSINSALEFAYNSKGCLLVAAAGNDYPNPAVVYPANNINVMAVSGMTKNWDHYGNTGHQIEISAPAEDIFSTSYNESTHQPIYDSKSGTSASSPMVAGTAALLWSNYPNLTNFDIRRILKETAYSNFSTYNELFFGKGLIKIDAAFQYVSNMPNKPAGVSISAPFGGHPTISWNPVAGADYYKVYRSEPNLKMVLTPITTITNTSYTDQNITVVHPKFAPYIYYYRVSAVNSSYESPVSSDVSCGSNSIEKSLINYPEENISYFDLSDNYPNPFNPSTKIKYTLAKDCEVVIKLYSCLGEEIATLINENKLAGSYTINLDGSNLSSGVYFYQLIVGNYVETKKMLLLR